MVFLLVFSSDSLPTTNPTDITHTYDDNDYYYYYYYYYFYSY